MKNEELLIEELNNAHMNSAEAENEEEEEIINNTNKSFEGEFRILDLIFKKIKNNLKIRLLEQIRTIQQKENCRNR